VITDEYYRHNGYMVYIFVHLKANDWDKDIIPNDEVMRGHIFAPVG
jgi:hypothetical protein